MININDEMLMDTLVTLTSFLLKEIEYGSNKERQNGAIIISFHKNF